MGVSQVVILSVLAVIFVSGCTGQESQLNESQENETSIPITATEEQPIKVDWTQLNSPPGGGYWTISISKSNPDTVLVASRDFNILKTTDAGENWKLLGEKLFGAHIFSNMIIHPDDENKIIISNGALYYTDDGGTVWYAVDNSQIGSGETEGVTALAIDDDNPSILYAGQENDFYKSTDFGKTWNRLSSVEGSTIRGIAVADAIYVMNSGSGLWKSIDSGATFTKIDEVSEVFSYNHIFHDTTNGNLYFSAANGLYKYSGGSWAKLPKFDSQNQPIAVSASGDTVYATASDKSVYKSIDGGSTWTEIFSADDIRSHQGNNFAVATHHDFSDIVYVATDNQILKSTDGGATWQDVGKDVKDDSLFVMGYAKDTKTIWVGAYWTRGLFKTTDEGNTWEFVEGWRSAEPHDHYPMSMIVDPQETSRVYVSGAYGVKVTENNSEKWTALGNGTFVHNRHVHGIYLDPSDTVLYAGSSPGWGQGYQVSRLMKSTDSGSTWEGVDSFPSMEDNNVYAFAGSGEAVYVTLNQHESDSEEEHFNSLGVWKSGDSGITWQDVSSNLPNKNAFSIAVHPENPNTVYVGLGHVEQFTTKGEQGLFKSTSGGVAWAKIKDVPDVQPSKIRYHPLNSDIVLVSFGEHVCGACASPGGDKDENKYPKGAGVYGTVDSGENWYNLVPEGTFTKRRMAVMDFVFADENTIYAVTDDGIFKGIINLKGEQ